MSRPADSVVQVSHFFETLKSPRRLRLIKEINQLVASSMPTHIDCRIDELEDLAGVEVYSGDGHYHKTSTHEAPIKGKKRAVGHFYTLNMRTHALTHLTGADHEGGRKKSEHDMHALKRMSTDELRQGAPKGRQVLYVWDKAGIDIPQWYRWKQSAGVYFLSSSKELFKLTFYGENDFDKADPVNQGVLEDKLVTNATSQVTFRYIKYQCPDTGTFYEFVTNHMKIRPGVLAWLYKRRWDIEKTYDTLKNKMEETQAWAGSDNAKEMQAHFICLAHNLMVLLDQRMGKEHGLHNEKETLRCAKREQNAVQRAAKNSRQFAPLYLNARRRSQLALKFIRWLRHHIQAQSTMLSAVASLRRVYAVF
jgi:hypothetical protein